MNNPTRLCLMAILICLINMMSVAFSQKLPNQLPDSFRGRIAYVPLGDLCNGELKLACQMVKTDPQTAIPILEKIYAADSNNMVAFTALLQCNIHEFDPEIDNFTNHLNAGNLYRIGTIYLYRHICFQSVGKIVPSQGWQFQLKALSALKQAWSLSHKPIIGLMYMHCLIFSPTNNNWLDSTKPIWRILVADLAGNKAFMHYQKAERNHWDSEMPDINTIKSENRLLLRALLTDIQNLCNVTITNTFYQNGKKTITKIEPTIDNKRQSEYLSRWISILDK